MQASAVADESGTSPTRPSFASLVPERPALAPGVELAGIFADGAFKEPQWLIVRNGHFLQVPELIYRVAEYADGQRTLGEIAAMITASTRWNLTAQHVHWILLSKLMPVAIVLPDGPTAQLNSRRTSPPPLQLRLKRKVLGPRAIEPITTVLRFLFLPPLVIPIMVAVILAHAWLYVQHGMMASIRDAIYTAGALPGVLLLVLVSAIVHEFGHASALHYGGGRARSIGVGLYLIYPAFYTDTTDSYRLGRWARVRTDLGGFYFQFIFALAVFGLYLLTAQEWLLVTVVIIDLLLVRQLIPLVRFDGYWALTDLIGIPDVLAQVKLALRERFRKTRMRTRQADLKPWAGVAFAVYAVFTVPLLAAVVMLLMLRAPAVFSALLSAFLVALDRLGQTVSRGLIGPAAAATGQVLLTAMQAAGLGYVLFLALRAPVKGLWRWSAPKASRRIGSAALISLALGGLLYYWSSSLGLTNGGAPAGVQTFDVSHRNHTLSAVSYPQSPPVGGPHSPIWQNCGFYTTPIANVNGVHSMEHGAVWITFRPDLKPSEVAVLRVLASKQTYVVASPYPGLTAPIVVSAWGRQLRVNSATDTRLDQFLRAFRLGHQAPEHGGPCTGGLGTPAS